METYLRNMFFTITQSEYHDDDGGGGVDGNLSH